MDRRDFLKLLGIPPISFSAEGRLVRSAPPLTSALAVPSEVSLDQMIDSFLPGELVVFAGVNTSLLRKVLRYELKKKGLIVINYSEWLRNIDDEFFQELGLWEACRLQNQRCRRQARMLGVPIVAIVHSASDHKRPPLESDIFQFGGLNQEADKIIFVYRDPKPIGDGEFPILLKVGKNRSGPQWTTTKLSWSRGRIRELRATTPLRSAFQQNV